MEILCPTVTIYTHSCPKYPIYAHLISCLAAHQQVAWLRYRFLVELRSSAKWVSSITDPYTAAVAVY